MALRTAFNPMGGGSSEKKTPAGTVIFDNSNPGTYTITIPTNQNYEVSIKGGGGGSGYAEYWDPGTGIHRTPSAGGGGGGRITGITKIAKGTYSISIGGRGSDRSQSKITYGAASATGDTGGQSSFLNNIAYGGGGGYAYATLGSQSASAGGGGGTSVVSAGLTGTNGSTGGSDGNGRVYIIAR